MNLVIAKSMKTLSNIRIGTAKWWHNYSKSKIGVIGLVIFIIILLVVILAPVLATHDPREMTPDKTVPPSSVHLFGTDIRGRDLFSMVLYAGQVSLFVGLVSALCIMVISTAVGLLAGYLGGIADETLMRIADVLMVLPRLPLLIVLAALMSPGIETIIIVVVALGWTRPARLIRALTLSLKQSDYVESTRASGGSSLHIIFHHILPNVTGVMVAQFVTEVVMVILMETGLSFLGFGDPLRFSWGQILYWAQAHAALTMGWWWWWLPAGLAITMVCFSLAFIGTTLNDRFVLKLKWRGKD